MSWAFFLLLWRWPSTGNWCLSVLSTRDEQITRLLELETKTFDHFFLQDPAALCFLYALFNPWLQKCFLHGIIVFCWWYSMCTLSRRYLQGRLEKWVCSIIDNVFCLFLARVVWVALVSDVVAFSSDCCDTVVLGLEESQKVGCHLTYYGTWWRKDSLLKSSKPR